ncbi:MAG: NGG1p interacting factor NIF3 [Pseudomonadota bacterium]
MNETYKIQVYIPVSDVEAVKTAMFDAGAGRLGDYDLCCWQTLGEGQFRPLKGSNPHIGNINEIEKVPEYKVEILCEKKILKNVIAAMMKVHPYEEPAYDVISRIDSSL